MIFTHTTIVLLFPLFFILCFPPLSSQAASSITPGNLIRDGPDPDTLLSDGLNFELGFFSKGNNSSLRYVGIWYYRIPKPEIVWVANRDKPINGRVGVIKIGNDGNLVIFDGDKNQVWSSDVSNPNNHTEAVLRDDGNLVLSSTDDAKEIWKSFDHPTDTFLPNMTIPVNPSKGEIRSFVSWKSSTDPARGNFSMGIDPRASTQIVIWEGDKRRWRSGYWDGRIFTGVSNMTGNYLYGFKLNTDANGGRHLTYTPLNIADKVRFQIGWDGLERQFKWNEGEKNWIKTQEEPYNKCEIYNKCGSFAECSLLSPMTCACIRGFEPKEVDQWTRSNWSGGCKRMTPLMAERNNNSNNATEVDVEEDGFLQLQCRKLPDSASLVNPQNKGDCESYCLQDTNCTAYAYVNGIGCLIWHGELLDIKHFENGGGNTLYIRLAHSDLGDGKKKMKIVVVFVIVLGLICLGISLWLVWRFKGRKAVAAASCCKMSDIPVFDTTRSRSRQVSAEFSGSAELSLEGHELSGPELPLFNFDCIAIATDNFSEENRLGQGGFGPVYKGKLRGEEQIAVKRLSRKSGQGLEEFKNEMMLIAKLQHRNLVRLLGCSIQGDEKLLVYEYMPNKSLDCFLFDPVKQLQLDWKKRFEIIEGIARGLLYLHRDSRLRIIHRDLKASNILLDEDMIPKISDFGLARIFGGGQSEANTTRVVGTYGYMSPEYAMEGLFSVKSDVYSFGVLLLEIISGRKNTSFRHSDDSSLIGYAWHLWNEQRAMELVDPSIQDSCTKNKVLRCIHIGMLCVQDSAAHRPTMSSVVLMLESETTNLPLPRQPLLTSMRRRSEDTDFYVEGLDVSLNELTVTMVVGR
ncbi:G-type lectin S-receptor-like serine/threonine-protein kinase B120 isoform X2 [Prosopis cineraria]|uniref:G-type lectin S-receptor-like serine/threonine-protein kinase B120 isoform X2 n=1 Tax=Prosopis cineraria TaxID=364024 RepID=UPI00240FA228|nr:G-type lectin S-receptor-like serine/threonine-protein kinase B120 isoform X2 [Prosopis cineraria]